MKINIAVPIYEANKNDISSDSIKTVQVQVHGSSLLKHYGINKITYDGASDNLWIHIIIYIILAIIFALMLHSDLSVLLPHWQSTLNSEQLYKWR